MLDKCFIYLDLENLLNVLWPMARRPQCPSFIISSQRKAWEDSSASYSGVSRAVPWCYMLGFTACGGGGSVEVYTNFILHGKKAVKIGKDSVTWMWLPGTGEVIAAELRRMGQQRVLLPSPDRFVVSTGLTLLPLAQKFSNSIRALWSLVKKKKILL